MVFSECELSRHHQGPVSEKNLNSRNKVKLTIITLAMIVVSMLTSKGTNTGRGGLRFFKETTPGVFFCRKAYTIFAERNFNSLTTLLQL